MGLDDQIKTDIRETGTGKEVVANAIHGRSSRRKMPLCCLNCGALRGELIESALFGHERGAFTGASVRKKGLFEQADGGVLLDEVGELSPAAQVALLRVLEDKKITRVGSHQEIAVDVRVIAATHRDLEAMCADGTFRREGHRPTAGFATWPDSLARALRLHR